MHQGTADLKLTFSYSIEYFTVLLSNRLFLYQIKSRRGAPDPWQTNLACKLLLVATFITSDFRSTIGASIKENIYTLFTLTFNLSKQLIIIFRADQFISNKNEIHFRADWIPVHRSLILYMYLEIFFFLIYIIIWYVMTTNWSCIYETRLPLRFPLPTYTHKKSSTFLHSTDGVFHFFLTHIRLKKPLHFAFIHWDEKINVFGGF